MTWSDAARAAAAAARKRGGKSGNYRKAMSTTLKANRAIVYKGQKYKQKVTVDAISRKTMANRLRSARKFARSRNASQLDSSLMAKYGRIAGSNLAAKRYATSGKSTFSEKTKTINQKLYVPKAKAKASRGRKK